MPYRGERRERLLGLKGVVPLALHCLELSVCGEVTPDSYEEQIALMARETDAVWVSDHLGFTRSRSAVLGQFVAAAHTMDAARRTATRVGRLIDLFERPLLLENITYDFLLSPDLTEAQFIAEVCRMSGCLLLLDVNNLFVNSKNHGESPVEFLDSIPLERVTQLHLAGHSVEGGWYEDSHDCPVSEDVWSLAMEATRRAQIGAVSIERDSNFPEHFESLVMEVERARSLLTRVPNDERAADRSVTSA